MAGSIFNALAGARGFGVQPAIQGPLVPGAVLRIPNPGGSRIGAMAVRPLTGAPAPRGKMAQVMLKKRQGFGRLFGR